MPLTASVFDAVRGHPREVVPMSGRAPLGRLGPAPPVYGKSLARRRRCRPVAGPHRSQPSCGRVLRSRGTRRGWSALRRCRSATEAGASLRRLDTLPARPQRAPVAREPRRSHVPRCDSALRATPRWLPGERPMPDVHDARRAKRQTSRSSAAPASPRSDDSRQRGARPVGHFWGTSPMDTSAAGPSRARSCSAAGAVRMNGRRACLTRRTIG